MPDAMDSLLYLLNQCIHSSLFPEDLKLARITPADVHDYGNYRPISVLPILSKVLERHTVIQFTSFLNEHNLLYRFQSGFRSHHSCQTALTNIIDDILEISKLETNQVQTIENEVCLNDQCRKSIIFELEILGMKILGQKR